MSMSLRRVCALCAALVVSISVVACQQLPAPNPAQSSVARETEAEVTPASTIATEVVITGTVPTPTAGYSVVAGAVVEKSSGAPPSEAVMFLGELVGMEDSFPLVTVDRQKSPKAIPSPDTGRFIFVDVPPGQYGSSTGLLMVRFRSMIRSSPVPH